MKHCQFCGSEIEDNANFCPFCGRRQDEQTNGGNASNENSAGAQNGSGYNNSGAQNGENNYFNNTYSSGNGYNGNPYGGQNNNYRSNQSSDSTPDWVFWLISILFPIVGLILFFVMRADSPAKAHICLKGFLISICIRVALGIIFSIIGLDFAGAFFRYYNLITFLIK